MPQNNLLSSKQYRRQFRTAEFLHNPRTLVGLERYDDVLRKAWALPSADTETVASYLNKRLSEINVKFVLTIPGDYIAEWVETLDSPCSAGLIRVHPNNEMCATYAADGYGRAAGGRTVGCVATTFGAGSLNAVQAVAGAYVEDVPLVLVNGTPSAAQFNSQRDEGVLWHHMFDGSLTDLKIFEQITRMAVRIDNPAFAPELIDAALTACITYSKPIYIEIATTMAGLLVQPVSQRAPLRKAPVPQNQNSLAEAAAIILQVLIGSERLVVIGGVEIARFGLQENFTRLLRVLQAPYVSSLLGKSILSEYDAPYFSGTYNGRNSQQNVQDLVNDSDVLLSLGVLETDFNFSGIGSTDFNPQNPPGLPIEGTIEVRMGAARINAGISPQQQGEVYWGDIALGPLIDTLADAISNPTGDVMNALIAANPDLRGVMQALIDADGQLPGAPFAEIKGEIWDIPVTSAYDPKAQITWDSFKSFLYHNYLNTFGNDEKEDAPVLLADTGLTFYNLNNVKVPQNGYIAQLSWGAIGYSPAASYGVKLALNALGKTRRVISVSGDGAFAESCNAIGTIADLGFDNVVFVMANGVFAIEQFLVDPNAFCKQQDPDQGLPQSDNPPPKFAGFTRVPQTALWDWKALAKGFGGVGHEVTTNAELAQVLARIKDGSPPPPTASGPCANESGFGCCSFEDGNTPLRKSTFTLVAVRNVCNDLPSNTRWKMDCGNIQPILPACPDKPEKGV